MFSAVIISLILYMFLMCKLLRGDDYDKNTKKVIWFYSSLSLLSIQLFFFVTFPLTIDRSFSVWMLSTVQNEKVVSLDYLSELTENSFLNGTEEVARRVSEQVAIGNLLLSGDSKIVTISRRGHIQVLFNKLICNLFGLNQKYAYSN